MEIRTEAVKMKEAAPLLAASSVEQRNHALELIDAVTADVLVDVIITLTTNALQHQMAIDTGVLA